MSGLPYGLHVAIWYVMTALVCYGFGFGRAVERMYERNPNLVEKGPRIETTKRVARLASVVVFAVSTILVGLLALGLIDSN